MASVGGWEEAKDWVQAPVDQESKARSSPRALSEGDGRAQASAGFLGLRVRASVPDGYSPRAPGRSWKGQSGGLLFENP